MGRPVSRRALFVSNGHGEDAIGAQIAQRVKSLAGHRLSLSAFPIVGVGEPYRRIGIPVVGPQVQLPSEGLAYLRLRSMLKDIVAGGLGLIVRQLAFAWRHRDDWDTVVGIGDRVSLQLNSAIFKKPMVWVAIAYSIRVVPPGRQFGNPRRWRPLLNPEVKAFVRDPDSRAALQAMGYPSEYVGNPMRDALTPEPATARRVQAALRAVGWDGASPLVALLPGSRQEAFQNLLAQLEALRRIHIQTEGRAQGVVAWVPENASHQLTHLLTQSGWRWEEGSHAPQAGWTGCCGEGVAVLEDSAGSILRVPLLRGAFAEIIDRGNVVIGQTGTAVEQAAGLGKPVVAFESTGMVVTRRFLTVQQRLLRGAIEVVEAEPGKVADAVLAILSDPERYRSMAEAGIRLMGQPGATDAIARRIVEAV